MARKKLIVITGTPGTGKSTVAKALAPTLQLTRLNLHHYYKQISDKYNTKKKCYDINFTKLKRLVQKKLIESKNGLIIDSHIAHRLPRKLVDICIVLTCFDLKKLQQRLQKRKYFQKKIRENLESEIFQVCLTQAQEQGHQILVFDTSTKLEINKIVAKLKK